MKKNIKRLVLFIFLGISVFFLLLHIYYRYQIKRYKVPFMILDANISKVGEYHAMLDKKFNPDFTTAICLIPDKTSNKITPEYFDDLDARIYVYNKDNKKVYETYCIFGRDYKFDTGKRVYCLYLPNKAFPTGQYNFVLKVEKPASNFLRIPHKIIAYPVYEFLPMLAMFLFIMFLLSIVITIILLLLSERVQRKH